MKIRLTQDIPRYARLNKDIIVDAEPVADHPDLMRVKGFGAFENGPLVRSWELVLPDEELEALLNEG
jgi:pantothenate kinase